MLLEQFRGVIKKLNDIRFIGLRNYNCGSAFAVQVSNILLGCPKPINIFKTLIAALFFKRCSYELEFQSEAKILFVFSHSYAGRGDLKKIFNKVTGLIRLCDIWTASEIKPVFELSGLRLILYIPIWLMQMKSIEISLKEKLYLTAVFIESKKWALFIEKNALVNKYKLLVTFCDIHSADSIITQHFKKAGIFTATLQHGWYRKTLQNANEFNNIELGFEGFVSNRFLAWGEYIKNSAVQSGIPSEKIICIGNPQYIGFKPLAKNDSLNTFGIILGRSRKHCIIENRNLIEIANKIASAFGCKYIIKYHPGDTVNEINEYDNLIAPEYLADKYDKSTSLEDYIINVDFSLVGSSSVYADLLYMGEVAFCYALVNDDYDDLEWGKFKNTEEVFRLIKTYQQNRVLFRQQSKEVGQILCGKGNIAENYKAFFHDYT